MFTKKDANKLLLEKLKDKYDQPFIDEKDNNHKSLFDYYTKDIQECIIDKCYKCENYLDYNMKTCKQVSAQLLNYLKCYFTNLGFEVKFGNILHISW